MSSETPQFVSDFANSYVGAPSRTFSDTDPYLNNMARAIRKTRDFKEIQIQYLESSGIKTIATPENSEGITMISVIISGTTIVKDVTEKVALVNSLTIGCEKKDGVITIDTGKLNEYSDGDIQPGVRKLIQVVYIIEDVYFTEIKKLISPQYAESVMIVEKRNQEQEDGTCKQEVITGLSGNQINSTIYKINRDWVGDEYGTEYGTYTQESKLLTPVVASTYDRNIAPRGGGFDMAWDYKTSYGTQRWRDNATARSGNPSVDP